MDKKQDCEIYCQLEEQLDDRADLLPQRKILHTRILKLSLAKSKNSYGIMGRALFESGQLQHSLLPFKRATIINPEDPVARINLARTFLELGKENEAFSCVQKALCFSPNAYQLHNFIIRIFEEQGRLGTLGSFYKEAASMLADRDSVPALYSISAVILVSFKKYPQAFEMYEKAVEADPINPGHHYEYAMLLYQEGLFEEAIVQFEHVKRLNPRNKAAFNNIAHIHYCLGRIEKACEEFEHILGNRLESAGTYSNYILVLYHLDKGEEVISRYRDLLQPQLRKNGPMLKGMYREALRITQAILERHDIDEEMREFNAKKIKGLNLVLSFLN